MKKSWIFQPSKLHRKKYTEITWIFRPSKLHRKRTRKRRGNSSKFGLRGINVISSRIDVDSTWCTRRETTKHTIRQSQPEQQKQRHQREFH